jgi:hypothetical protein
MCSSSSTTSSVSPRQDRKCRRCWAACPVPSDIGRRTLPTGCRTLPTGGSSARVAWSRLQWHRLDYQTAMALPVSLDAVAEELDGLMEEMTAFINRKTGEIASVSSEEAALVEEEVTDEELPDWQVEMLPTLRSIILGDEWAALPDKFDIHEWEIMRQFADSVDDDALSERLHQAIHGRGAFRMFHATIDEADLRDDWYTFKHRALREIAREALEELGIPYQ